MDEVPARDHQALPYRHERIGSVVRLSPLIEADAILTI